jgi:hypothetical protein
MEKFLKYASFFGGLVIVLLGIIIMLMDNNMGHAPHDLVLFTLSLVFIVGAMLILYIVKNRGIS